MQKISVDKAKNVELIKKADDKILEEYITYGKEYYAGNLVYIREDWRSGHDQSCDR